MRRALRWLSCALSGLFAGAMLLVAVGMVPFWQGLPPAELRHLFASHAFHIRHLMYPLGLGAMLASIAAALGARGGARRSWLVLAAGAVVAVVAITLLVNEPANFRLSDGTLTDAETTALLASWQRWHHLRVAGGLVAFGAALRAVAP